MARKGKKKREAARRRKEMKELHSKKTADKEKDKGAEK